MVETSSYTVLVSDEEGVKRAREVGLAHSSLWSSRLVEGCGQALLRYMEDLSLALNRKGVWLCLL